MEKNPPFSLGLLEPRSQAIKDSQVLPQTFLYWPLSSSDLGSKEREKGTLLLLGFGLPSLSLFCGKIGSGLFLKFSTLHPFRSFSHPRSQSYGKRQKQPERGGGKERGVGAAIELFRSFVHGPCSHLNSSQQVRGRKRENAQKRLFRESQCCVSLLHTSLIRRGHQLEERETVRFMRKRLAISLYME